LIMRRLGLVWRVTLIVIAALVAIQMIAAAAYYVQRGRATEQGFRLPLPDQMAALVELVERAGNRSLALRVANGPGLRVAIADTAPPVAEPIERVAWLENAIARYIGDGRMVRAYYIGPARGGESKRRPGLENFSHRPVRLVVPLSDGEFIVAETVDDLTVRVLGLPPGFWAGIIGFLVAALALYAVVRETIPLSRLARSVDRFAEAIEPAPVPLRGAREVPALIGAFNRMQSRIAELVRNRTFMLAAISHDLRTYLTRLRLRVEMMPDPDMRERATRDVEEMSGLLDDALTFARTSFTGNRSEQVDLSEIVHRECSERAAAGQTVKCDVSATPIHVWGDPAALARIVGNLIDNAVKYGGEATVTLSRAGTQAGTQTGTQVGTEAGAEAIMLVDDRGPGVPGAERERIFEPFLRLEASRNRDRGGAGLGLAIARHLVLSLGGIIAVEDRPGGGARFRVTLPARQQGL
jgi:two-component system, OmpR family, osmolarity sensor histidine kinase EnvZ